MGPSPRTHERLAGAGIRRRAWEVSARFRETLGIRGRQTVVVGLSGGSLRVRTLDSALERLQRIARRRNPDAARVVDDFIDDRRAEEIVVIR